MTAETSLAWFALKGTDFNIGSPPPVEFGEGWERVLGWAKDASQRPHDQTARELLTLECREMADLLVNIANEEGHTHFLGGVLRLLVIEAARGGAS